MLKPWTFLSRSEFAKTRIYRILVERWRSPRTALEHDFSVIDSADWVNVLALDQAGAVVLIRQFRFGTRAFTLEVAGGMIDADEAPEHAAARELREETGYRAGRIVSLGAVEPNPAILNNRLHMFAAEGCVREGELTLDAGEDIEVVTLPLAQVVEMLERGELSHALVALCVHRYLLHREGKLRLAPAP
jgi:8-oxo-dGTP pyrophosphatase MutT (NUDIX family)